MRHRAAVRHALAGVGTGALDHQGRRRLPTCECTLAASGSWRIAGHAPIARRRRATPPARRTAAAFSAARAHGDAEEPLVEMLRRRRTCGWRCPAASSRSANVRRVDVGRDRAAPGENSPRSDRRAAPAAWPVVAKPPPLVGRPGDASAGRSPRRPTGPRPRPPAPSVSPTREGSAGGSVRPRPAAATAKPSRRPGMA